jgi:hypothetical protein
MLLNQHFLESVKLKEWAANAEQGDLEVYKKKKTAPLASSLSCGNCLDDLE